MDRSSKLKIEPKLQDLLDSYSIEIIKYQKIIRQKIDDFESHKAVLEPILRTSFQKFCLTDNSGYVIRHRNNINSISDWLIDYSSVFFSSKVNDSKILYDMLDDYVAKSNF